MTQVAGSTARPQKQRAAAESHAWHRAIQKTACLDVVHRSRALDVIRAHADLLGDWRRFCVLPQAALRVVESLSEHALCEPLTWPVMFKSDGDPGVRHSPEFISMMFHSMRWVESLSDDNAAQHCML